MSTDELLMNMCEEIKITREELDEIKVALISEVVPTELEMSEIMLGNKEIKEGKYRTWKDIKLA